jgi:hypothetical protein
MIKGEIRWDKFAKGCGNLKPSDTNIINHLATFKKNLKWIDLIPVGLRISYVSNLSLRKLKFYILCMTFYIGNNLRLRCRCHL